MSDHAGRQLDVTLVPAEGAPDAQVLDDLIRLIHQGVATMPKDVPRVADGPGFRKPSDEEARDTAGLEAQIKHRIEQESQNSQSAAERRNALAAQPGSEPQLADEAIAAAQAVVAAVQRALIRGIDVRIPDRPRG